MSHTVIHLVATPEPRLCPKCNDEAKSVYEETTHTKRETRQYAVCPQGHEWDINEYTTQETT